MVHEKTLPMDRLIAVSPETESNICGIYDKGRFQIYEET